MPEIESAFPDVPNTRWVALRLLNADEAVQSAVRSGELGQLVRDDSEVEVVVPNGRGIKVTATGERLAHRARSILDALVDAEDEIRALFRSVET